MTRNFIGTLFICALLSACGTHENKQAVKQDILIADLDTTVNPAEDFFHYAEGGWLKRNPIPADESKWGIGSLVKEELYNRLKDINEEAVKKSNKTVLDQQIADFWLSGMDSAAIEKNGIEPLRQQLNKIESLKTPADVMAYAAELQIIGVNVFFGAGVQQDAKRSDQMGFIMWQGGIGLPDRDYYFNKDTVTAKIRNEYPKYIARIFRLAGKDSVQAQNSATAIVSLETKLANSSRKLEALRDPYANYNKIAISDLHKLSPQIDWVALLKIMKVHGVDSVIVGQPEFYQELDKLITHEKIETLKDYMTFHLIQSYAQYLNTAILNADFDFYEKLIEGADKLHPRWKRVLDAEEGAIGEALGQLFAQKYFNETAKKRYSELVENIRTAYKARITKLDWMSDSTKQTALRKLSTIRKKVGYPDKWKDFSQLKISRESYAANVMSAQQWWNQYNTNKLGKPVNRDEWDMTPQTYNAYYNPSNNEIVLPAGIFTVPGYRDEELDDALVYGYSGASTIGHEITHGFDDEGRQFDEKGNLKNWWSKDDAKQFDQRANVLVGQFNNIIAIDTFHINGKATLGENLADLGGLLLALDAFKQTDTYKKGEKINGETPVQRFFLGYALGWMLNIRKEQMVKGLMSDVHSPAQFRVNGPFPNIDEFYTAFNIKPGDKMYIADSLRVHLW